MDIDQYEDEIRRTCGICDKVFKDESDLDEHVTEHEIEEEDGNDQIEPSDSLVTIINYAAEDEGIDSSCDPLSNELNPSENQTYFVPMKVKEESENSTSNQSEFLISQEGTDNLGLTVKEEDIHHIDIKKEPFDSFTAQKKPKQKYSKLKPLEGKLYRRDGSKFECLGCASVYDSNHGLYYHLKTTSCGFGEKHRSKPKAKWNQYYTKQENSFCCLACGKNYETIRGIHYHLSKTSVVCATPGGARREDGEPIPIPEGSQKMSWSAFYTRQDDLFACITCAKVYESVNGMHYHLKTSPLCTSMTNPAVIVKQEEEVEKTLPSYRRDYRHLYRKGDMGELQCLGCGVEYGSIHGLHCHLNATSCGFGEKLSKGKIKNSYTGLYRKESDSCFICLACSNPYSSMHGLHYHLNRTKCGYGQQERCQVKRNYKGLYVRREEDNLYMCLGPGCGFTMGYLTGMHRHLRECPMAGMMQEPKLEDIEYEHYSEPEVIVEEVETQKEPEDIQQNYISQGEDA